MVTRRILTSKPNYLPAPDSSSPSSPYPSRNTTTQRKGPGAKTTWKSQDPSPPSQKLTTYLRQTAFISSPKISPSLLCLPPLTYPLAHTHHPMKICIRQSAIQSFNPPHTNAHGSCLPQKITGNQRKANHLYGRNPPIQPLTPNIHQQIPKTRRNASLMSITQTLLHMDGNKEPSYHQHLSLYNRQTHKQANRTHHRFS